MTDCTAGQTYLATPITCDDSPPTRIILETDWDDSLTADQNKDLHDAQVQTEIENLEE